MPDDLDVGIWRNMRFPIRQTLRISSYLKRKKKLKEKRFPLVLMLEPLFACNFTCSGCGRIKEYAHVKDAVVPLEKCMRAVESCNAPVVSICGGEPLLYPKIGDLIEGCLKMKRVVYLCTNGWALKNKLADLKPHHLFNINVHIDGLQKTHDAIVERGGAFDRAIEGIIAAKKMGFTVCTNTTIYNQTDPDEICSLFRFLEDIGVDGLLISPAFDYADVDKREIFLAKEKIREKFNALKKIKGSKKLWTTPLFFEFLEGKRDFMCTPWGNVTYNAMGWKSPCYLITDKHFGDFSDFINETSWERYGSGKDPRCENCMAHCGIEPTIALHAASSIKDGFKMAIWTMLK